jgi:uncharacterized membrane protein
LAVALAEARPHGDQEKRNVNHTEKTATGLDANVAAALAYALGWLSGVAFLLGERDNRFVRFHAMQSTIVFGSLSAAFLLLQTIPFLGLLLAVFIIVPLSAVLWLVLMFKAYQGEQFKLPMAGDMAESRV